VEPVEFRFVFLFGVVIGGSEPRFFLLVYGGRESRFVIIGSECAAVSLTGISSAVE
jgi:hypothetical protein